MSSTPTLGQANTENQKFRSQIGQVSRHSGVFFAGTVFSVVAGYLLKVYLARVLGAQALGVYALGMTMVGFFGIFNGLGLPESAVRFVAAYSASGQVRKLRSFLWQSAGILLAANAVFVSVFLLSGSSIAKRFYHSAEVARYLPFFAMLLLVGPIRTFLEKAMAGYQNVSCRTLIVNFVGTPTTIVSAVLLISTGAALKGYLLAQIASSLVVLVLMAVAIRQLTPRQEGEPQAAAEKMDPEVRSFSATVLGMGFLGFLIGQADKVTLGYFLGAREVGIYAVAAALVVYVALALRSVNQIFAPMIADLHTRGDHAVLARLFQTLTRWIIAMTVPLAAVMIVFARPVMSVFGREFEAGWSILIIGTVGELVNCGVGSVGYLLLMSGHQRSVMKIQAVTAVLMVSLNVLLVPYWGIVGAAVAAATTNAATNAWYLLEVRSVLKLSPYNRSYFKLLPATALAVSVLWLLYGRMAGLGHVVPALIAALVVSYTVFLVSFMSFGLTEDDRMILGAVRRRLQAVLA